MTRYQFPAAKPQTTAERAEDLRSWRELGKRRASDP